MNKVRFTISLLLAFVFAVAGSSLVYKWLQNRKFQEKVATKLEDKVRVAVAAKDLPWGTKLTKEMLGEKIFSKDNLPAGHFTTAASVQNRVLILPVKRNEIITGDKLAPVSVTTGGVAAVISEGKRAIAVKGNKVLGLAGFIQPGDRVDVLVTVKNPDGQKKSSEVTKTVLQDILVLATGTEIEKPAKGEKPSQVDVYTLEVTPEEGEELGLAATQGTLHFALRNVLDKQVVLTRGANLPRVLAAYRDEKPYEILCIRGAKASTQSFTAVAVEH